MLALPSANSLKRMKQTSFATLAEARKKRKTNRRRFWEEMKTVVLWGGLIEPHYPKLGRGSVFLGVALKSTTKHKLTAANQRFKHKMSSVGSREEHLFRVIKRQFSYTKVRYKRLAKNVAQVFTILG